MKKILFANYLALLFACDLPNVENPSLESIKSEVIMEDFDTNDLLNWNIVNDTVMGGASQATLELTNDKYANFSGFLSLENNGGFSSIRAYYPPDLTNVKSIVLRIKGDGRKYNFRIRGNSFSWASYTYPFDTIEVEVGSEYKNERFYTYK